MMEERGQIYFRITIAFREERGRPQIDLSPFYAASIFARPSAIAATSASISTSVMGVDSVAEQVLIMMKPASKR